LAVCLNGHWKEVRREIHRRLSRDIPDQRDNQMGGNNPSEDTVIDVCDGDDREALDEELTEEMFE
jgi:hypothetical protein